jgi:hypothetical protein
MTYPPSHSDLTAKAITYLKENHPKEYRTMTIPKRNQYAELAATRAERYAKNMIAQGIFESEAWNMAIRSEILSSETD